MTAALDGQVPPQVVFSWRERLGLAHLPQVVELPAPPLGIRSLRQGAQAWPLQRLHQRPDTAVAFLTDGIAADETIAADGGAKEARGPVSTVIDGGAVVLDNGRFAVRLRLGAGESTHPDGIHPGPLLGVRVGESAWHGRSHLDTRSNRCLWRGELLEDGTVRAVYRFSAELGSGRSWACTITLDAGVDFARVEEASAAGPADQAVWTFSDASLPRELLLLDAGSAHRVVRPHWHHDQPYARLWGWTQCSQLREDGVGLAMADGTVIGCVVLDGGSWSGGAVNSLECWARRLRHGDPATRRGLPAGMKADSTAVDAIPARGAAVCTPVCCLEASIERGRRCWALVAAPRSAVDPADAAAQHPGHFECVPRDIDAYRVGQGLLRRIWIQHGLLPLQRQIGMVLAWPDDLPSQAACRWPHAALGDQHDFRTITAGDPLTWIRDYLAARVLGLWHGSGAAYSNVVVGRPIAPAMAVFEHLTPSLDAATRERLRARFAMLAYLNADEGFYAGDATMRPLGDPDGSEPYLQGMANQNFFTDALVIPGTFGEVFPAHPQAAAWRAWAARMWERQLEFHVYPESGLWEESHTYYHHVLNTVWPWLLRRRDEGHGDGFADERLRALVGSAVTMATPRDARLGGLRLVAPIGDHGPDPAGYRWLYHRCAEAVAAHDPVLAGRLGWLHRECGGIADGPITAPAWRPSLLRGLGAFLRGRDARGRDDLLLLRCGGAWAHHHNDDGALLLYANDRGLVGDCCGGEYPETAGRKFAADGHSRWTPDGAGALNVLWRFARGWIQAADVDALHPWSLAWCPTRLVAGHGLGSWLHNVQVLPQTIRHQRLAVRLDAGLWLIVDRTDGIPGRARFHLGGRPQTHGLGVRLALPDGEALHVQALWPAAPATVHAVEIPTRRPELHSTEVSFPTCPDGTTAIVLASGGLGALRLDSGEGNGSIERDGSMFRMRCDALACLIESPAGTTRIAWPAWPE